MKDKDKTKEQLINEIQQLRKHLAGLQKPTSKDRPIKEACPVTEKALKESEEKYRLLTESIVEGIVIIDFTGKILYSNEPAAKMVGYKSAEEGLGKNVFSFIHNDSKKRAVLDLLKVYRGKWGFLTIYKAKSLKGKELWVETMGRKTTYQGKAVELIVFRDITERREVEEELKKAKDRLEVTVKERTAELTSTNKQLILEVNERKKAEDDLQKSLKMVQRLFKETVAALASAVEAKDPYTAGHQKRVSQLACVIAEEMHLPKNQIDGIGMAAIVHDIGKIHVPTEILTKPTKLTDIELKMIAAHPQFGYDILKTIEFPWPIAEIVLQHHEKMNGSGYPLGISGENILLEARILVVADVVEAISTHRPYRAALGTNVALKKILEKRRTYYDPDVVDACLRVFSEKGFKFEKQ